MEILSGREVASEIMAIKSAVKGIIRQLALRGDGDPTIVSELLTSGLQEIGNLKNWNAPKDPTDEMIEISRLRYRELVEGAVR